MFLPSAKIAIFIWELQLLSVALVAFEEKSLNLGDEIYKKKDCYELFVKTEVELR